MQNEDYLVWKQVTMGEQVVFDSKALNGLRGLAALHILIFHAFYCSTLNINILGAVQNPLFFLLSGFCLTLSHARSKPLTNSESTWIFYQNRLARILPVYYFCYFVALILIPLGYTQYSQEDPTFHPVNVATSLLLIQTWIMFPLSPNVPAWTVSTLIFFYIVYPRLLVFAQKCSNQGLANLMALSFYFQMVTGFIIMGIPTEHLNPFPMPFLINYWLSTQHPLARLPVFFMGICAGVLCTRIQDGDLDALKRIGRWSDNKLLSFIEDTSLPFPFFQKVQDNDKDLTSSWKRRVDVNVIAYFTVLAIFSLMNTIYATLGYENNDIEIIEGEEISQEALTKLLLFAIPNMACGMMQFTACYVQLMIIVGLCLDGQGHSWASKLFRSSVMQFLGKISMTLYLIHCPLIYWIKVALFGDIGMTVVGKQPDVPFPVWPAIPLLISSSLLSATLLTKFIEEPTRRFFKPKSKTE